MLPRVCSKQQELGEQDEARPVASISPSSPRSPARRSAPPAREGITRSASTPSVGRGPPQVAAPPSFTRAPLGPTDSRLNLQPTLWLGVPILIAAAVTSAILELHVVESATAHLTVFAVGTYVIFTSYFTADYYLSRLSTSYAQIDERKKFYVLSNLIKSAVRRAGRVPCKTRHLINRVITIESSS